MQTQRKSMTPCTHIRWAFKKWLFWYSVGYFENGRWVSAMIVGDFDTAMYTIRALHKYERRNIVRPRRKTSHAI